MTDVEAKISFSDIVGTISIPQVTPAAQPPHPSKRKVVQISFGTETNPIGALCDDGTMWSYNKATTKWSRIPDVPPS